MNHEAIIVALIAFAGVLLAPVDTAWANYYFEQKKKQTKKPRSPRATS